MKAYTDWEDFQNDKTCHVWVATAIIGASVIGGLSTAYAANKASSTQQKAATTAADIARTQYNTTRGDLAPYRDAGTAATKELQDRLPFLTSPIVMDQDALEKTPGYQFTRTQGLKAVQNSAAARGLAVSGAAQKGAADFATGLANKTYQDQFNLENINRTNAYNRLKSLVDTGENAAAGTGVIGSTAAGQAINATIGGANASAAGTNAIGSAVNNAANSIGGYAAYRGLYGSGGNNNNSYGNISSEQQQYWNAGNQGPV